MIAMIACKARNGTIGRNGQLPWHLPADLAFFKATTSGHTIVMGRKTYESIGRPLPKRRNIILTRDQEYQADGCEIVHTVESVLALDEPVFIIGGAEVYKRFESIAERLYITEIDEDIEGDTVLFPIDPTIWREISCADGVQDDRNPYHYRFVVYERIKP